MWSQHTSKSLVSSSNQQRNRGSLHTDVRSTTFKATEQPLKNDSFSEAWMHHTVKHGYPKPQCRLLTPACVSLDLITFPLSCSCASKGCNPVGGWCQTASHLKVSNARWRVWLRPGRYPNSPRWLVSCSATLFHTSCEELVCPWIRLQSSPVKPKGWPGILSFDPGLKGAPVLKLRSPDWLFLPLLLGFSPRTGTPPPFHLCF